MQQMQLNYETSRIQQDILTLQKYVVQCCYIPENSFIVYVYERRSSSYNFVSIHKSCCNNIHTKCQLQGVKLFSQQVATDHRKIGFYVIMIIFYWMHIYRMENT